MNVTKLADRLSQKIPIAQFMGLLHRVAKSRFSIYVSYLAPEKFPRSLPLTGSCHYLISVDFCPKTSIITVLDNEMERK